MAKSLQEQLLAAGAIKKDRAQRLKKQKHKQGRQQQRGAGEADEIKRAAEQSRAAKAEADRALAATQNRSREAREIAAQVHQLVAANRLETADGEIDYRFTDGATVRSLPVSQMQQSALTDGRLAIVRFDGGYALVPAAVAARIRERDDATVVVLHEAQKAAADPADPYAAYEIPDDLTW